MCLLFLVACGRADKGEGTTGSTSAGEYPAQFAAQFCELSEKCCAFSSGTFAADCETTRQAETQADADRAQAAGASFDGQAAADCLAGLEQASCTIDPISLLRELLPRCDVWRGSVQAGESCSAASECDDSQANISMACITGICAPLTRLPLGAACNANNPNMFCDALSAQCDEETGVCVALPGPGEPCSADCRVGSTCDVDVCRALGAAGDACTLGNECASDVCSAGQCASLLVGDEDECVLPE